MIFSFLLLIDFQKKFWFYYSLVLILNTFFFFWLLLFLKLFFAFFLRSVFLSLYDFSQVFWLNLIIPYTLRSANLCFNPCFKFFMCIKYSGWPWKLVTSFSTFQFSFFQTERVNYCENYVNFQNIEHHLLENNFHHFHHYSFLWNLPYILKHLHPI